MAGLNKVVLIGNLGKDPEIRNLDNGKSRATVSVATTEVYKNKSGEKVSNTEWHNVVFWSPLAEIVHNYLKKGSKVYIEGKISNRSYEDKEGNTKYITEIVARELIMLDTKPYQGNESREHSEQYESVNSDNSLDELPF